MIQKKKEFHFRFANFERFQEIYLDIATLELHAAESPSTLHTIITVPEDERVLQVCNRMSKAEVGGVAQASSLGDAFVSMGTTGSSNVYYGQAN